MTTTLLAVDDSRTMRKVIEITFAGEDYRTVLAENSADALTKARAESPTVALIDAQLGGENGYELCQKLKRELPNLLVVILSNKQQPFDRSRGASSGVDDFMDKPFDTQQLLDKVAGVLRKQGAPPARSATTTASGATAARPVGTPAAPATAGARPAPTQTQVAPSTVARGGAAPAPTMGAAAGASAARPGVPGGGSLGGPQPSPATRPGSAPGGTATAAAGARPAGASGSATSSTGVGLGATRPGSSPLAATGPAVGGARAPAASPVQTAVPPQVAPVAPAPVAPVVPVQVAAQQPPPATAVSHAAAPGPAVMTPAAQAAAIAALGVDARLEDKLGALGLNAEQVKGVLALSREVVEKVVWEVVPVLAETLIKEEIKRLTAN